jgi:hypothetical protein
MCKPTVKFLSVFAGMAFLGLTFLGLSWLAITFPDRAGGQAVIEDDRMILDLGSVHVGDASFKFLIAYSKDSALLAFSVAGSGGRERYVPLFASTYRGVPEVTLNAIVSKSKDQLWIQSSWPDNEILAYYRLGADAAITPFGTMGLLDTPFPQFLSGGPVGFPPFDPAGVQTLASFHYPGDR